MPSSSHQSLNLDPVNCVPLSMIILLRTLNLTTMSWKNSFALVAVIVVTGLASIHLVNLSMATKRCVKPPGALCRGSTMSKTPDCKQPSDRDSLQLLRRHVYLLGKILASLAFVDDFVCVCNSSQLEEILPTN